MKIAKVVLGIALALALGAIASGEAWADHGHSRVTFGINLGVPVGPWYYPPYYYPYPPMVALPAYPNAVMVQPSPPVYMEKGEETSGPTPRPLSYWYYCPDPQGYYPYVKDCQTGWLTVLPQSQGQPGSR